MKLVILCEGETERRVLKDFLAPYCTEFASVEVTQTGGAGNLKRDFANLAKLELSDPNVFVLCLIDLYQSPFQPYPNDVQHSANPPKAAYAYIKKYMEDKVYAMDGNFKERFFAFPVVREIETWLFADVSILNDYLSPPRKQRIQSYSTPETISHPAEELNGLFKRFKNRSYGKIQDGQTLFKKVDAKNVYADSCPHFEQLVERLLAIQGLLPEDAPETLGSQIPNEALYHELNTLKKQRESILEESLGLSLNDPRLQVLDAEDKRIGKEMEKIQNKLSDDAEAD